MMNLIIGEMTAAAFYCWLRSQKRVNDIGDKLCEVHIVLLNLKNLTFKFHLFVSVTGL
jgi:hypothetical protein